MDAARETISGTVPSCGHIRARVTIRAIDREFPIARDSLAADEPRSIRARRARRILAEDMVS